MYNTVKMKFLQYSKYKKCKENAKILDLSVLRPRADYFEMITTTITITTWMITITRNV